jgi:hypothetical protein
MADKPVIKDAVAIVPVRDVVETIRFYTDILGFAGQVLAKDNSYGSVRRGGAAMDLLATDDADALKATATNIALAVWVEGLDDLYAELKPKLDTLQGTGAAALRSALRRPGIPCEGSGRLPVVLRGTRLASRHLPWFAPRRGK